jgi:hypothetical protein
LFPLLAVAGTTLTGCATGSWSNPPARTLPASTETVPLPPSAPRAKATKFADILRIPGQQVPLNGSWPVEVPDHLPDPPQTDIAVPQPPKPLPDPPLVAALREYLAGRSGAEHLRQLDPASYEHLTQLLPAVVKLAQVPPGQLEPKEAGELLRQFDPTLAVVARRAPLRVEKAVFCKDVRGYGKYDPLPDRVPFNAGQMYILYLEVGNVPNEPDTRPGAGAGAGGFTTRLSCTVQVKDEAGRTVELADQGKKIPEPLLQKDKVDFSRSPVRDYYAVFWFYAPSKPGAYSVTFEVRDPATSRAVSRKLPFEVR